MTDCSHNNLVLLKKEKQRVRCRSCHLTISAVELNGGYCPECYETSGVKEYGFDPVAPPMESGITYRCEDCGAMIEC